MSADSGLFAVEVDDARVPLYESKMATTYDHRWANATASTGGVERLNPEAKAKPRYWFPAEEAQRRLVERGWHRDWRLALRKIARSTDERTLIPMLLPKCAVSNSATVMLASADTSEVIALASLMGSYAADFLLRQKLGGTNLNFFYTQQLAFPSPQALSTWDGVAVGLTVEAMARSVLELVYTSWDMAPLARDLDDVDLDGSANPPFRWDDERRFLLRSNLDAVAFHLYGIRREDVDYIMDTFPIVRRKDEAAHGEYRTKRVILEMYDAMQAAMESGHPYESPIDPPPGQGPRHPRREN
jgi:hypothetical protein